MTGGWYKSVAEIYGEGWDIEVPIRSDDYGEAKFWLRQRDCQFAKDYIWELGPKGCYTFRFKDNNGHIALLFKLTWNA